MQVFLPGAVFSGILTVVLAILLRARAGRPRLSVLTLALIGIAAAIAVPWALKLGADAWRAVPGLPPLPFVSFGQIFMGSLIAMLLLGLGNRPDGRPRVPLWAGLAAAVAVAVFVPSLLNLATGTYQRPSLRPTVNHCTRGMTGEVQPREVTNICDEPIVVGLCLPGETNPVPCAQTEVIQPGETARFDPGDERLSSLPSNLDGLTVVACRPPARPSRMGTTIGRGYEGVCLPPE